MSTGTGAGRRRRVRLTPMPPIPVEFSGERAGEGPLTLGQLDVYTWTSSIPDHPHGVLRVELPVPARASAGEVAGAVAALIARHETLRTTFVPGGQPRQRVAGSGVFVVEACSLGEGEWGPADRPAVAGALVRWLRESPDPGRRPVRVAVAVAGDRVIACAAGFTHLAVDHSAIEILRRDFAGLLAGPGRRPAGQAGPQSASRPGWQPLDQAELEASPAERARAEAALDYLREQFSRIPHCLYALPGARPSGESLAVELSSAAAAMAVRQVAARTRASRSSVVLAAICAVVARRAGYRELVLPIVSSNRFERHLANYVGPLAQGAAATVGVAGRSFDELVRHTWTTVLEASRLARCDTARRDAMNERIEHERGLRLNLDPFFNSLVPESWSGLTAGVGVKPEEIDLALARTELRWRPALDGGVPLRFSLNQVDGCLRLDAWSGDAGLLPRSELEPALLAVERLLVAAAHGDVAAGQVPEATGLEPIAGSPDRVLADSCWVSVADVQRLVEDAAAPAVTRVFASADGRPLVAHLTATSAIRTPEQAHDRCMAALARHPAAITPRHYVICPTAPPDPADPAAWPPPLATGTGRT
jgi:hypothetical protein